MCQCAIKPAQIDVFVILAAQKIKVQAKKAIKLFAMAVVRAIMT